MVNRFLVSVATRLTGTEKTKRMPESESGQNVKEKYIQYCIKKKKKITGGFG